LRESERNRQWAMDKFKCDDMHSVFDDTTKVSMVAGMLLGVFANVGGADLVKTVILAAVGAVVSFVVSQVLKAVVRWIRGM
jgi:hypothetical protein